MSKKTEIHFNLKNISVSFGNTKALSGVNLQIRRGESVAIIGPSGSGKSTLLRLLNASVSPTTGSVEVLGENLANTTPCRLREIRSRIGFIHQNLNLIANLRVIHNVLLGRLGRRTTIGIFKSLLLPSNTEQEEVYCLLKRVGIPEKLYQRTDRLSGGQQQRVAIARALYQTPDALIADEPVSSVDPARAKDSIELLCQVSKEDGLTLIASLHSLDLAQNNFNRIIGLRKEKIVFDVEPNAVSEKMLVDLYLLSKEEVLADDD